MPPHHGVQQPAWPDRQIRGTEETPSFLVAPSEDNGSRALWAVRHRLLPTRVQGVGVAEPAICLFHARELELECGGREPVHRAVDDRAQTSAMAVAAWTARCSHAALVS